jgi:hypothetical protein
MKQVVAVLILVEIWIGFASACPIFNYTLDPVNVSQLHSSLNLISFKGFPELTRCLPIHYSPENLNLDGRFTIDWEQIRPMRDEKTGTVIKVSSKNCSNKFGHIYQPNVDLEGAYLFYGCRVLDDGSIKEAYLFAQKDFGARLSDTEIENLMKFPKLLKLEINKTEKMQNICESALSFAKLFGGKEMEVYVESFGIIVPLFFGLHAVLILIFYQTQQYFCRRIVGGPSEK